MAHEGGRAHTRRRGLQLCAVLAACAVGCTAGTALMAEPEPVHGAMGPAPGRCWRVVNARAPGGASTTLGIRGGRFSDDVAGCEELDAEGRYITPAFIDSHVHLAYLPRGTELASNGVAAAIDLASPMDAFGEALPLAVRRSGPMITARGGYPTRGWGSDGYGIECEDAATCVAAVDDVVEAGAALIKVPLAGAPELDGASLRAIVERAHELDRRVAVHALSDAAAMRAAVAGADVLAHTPTEPLADATIDAWAGRAVVSTLRAFGGSSVENLRRLRAAGATVLYGTDFGNTRTAAIDAREIERLEAAGLDGAAILEAGTAAPAALWGFDELGGLELGREASFLLLDDDPWTAPATLAHPSEVWLRGAWVGPTD